MPVFFTRNRGTVSRYITNYTSPFAMSVNGTNFSHALLQNVSIDHEGGYQFQHALDNAIYIYVFGDRIGELVVSGRAFMDCYGNHGINQILYFYNSNRIAARSTPVRVVLGTNTFWAFMVGLRVEMRDPENLLADFSLRLKFFPSDSNSAQVGSNDPGPRNGSGETGGETGEE